MTTVTRMVPTPEWRRLKAACARNDIRLYSVAQANGMAYTTLYNAMNELGKHGVLNDEQKAAVAAAARTTVEDIWPEEADPNAQPAGAGGGE